MYKIIGADQREYGPVTIDQIKQWIAEGRANGATLVQAEGSADWVPLSTLPELNDALAAKAPPAAPLASPPPPAAPSDPEALATHIRARDYDIDIGRCLSRSWALMTGNFGLVIGATVVFAVLSGVLGLALQIFIRPVMISLQQGNISPGPILLLLVLYIPQLAFAAVLRAGLLSLLLKLIRGQPTGVGELFSGFGGPFIQLAAAGIVIPILFLIGALFCIVPGVYLAVAWFLTIPLIIDRRLDFWTAMELSRKVITQHWWLMFCLVIVIALINVAGFIACCIGSLAAFPLGLGALMYAYEDIFSGPQLQPEPGPTTT